MGTPLMGVSNAGGVSKNRDYRKVSRFITCCQCCDHKVLSTRCHWTVASDKRQSLLMTGDDKEVLMTKSLNVMPKTTEQHLIVCTDKSVACVTNNKRLRSTFYTIEANYCQTRSVVEPLCDSRATCVL